MTFTQQEAQLLLAKSGEGDGCIRPGHFTANQWLELVARLKACAGGKWDG